MDFFSKLPLEIILYILEEYNLRGTLVGINQRTCHQVRSNSRYKLDIVICERSTDIDEMKRLSTILYCESFRKISNIALRFYLSSRFVYGSEYLLDDSNLRRCMTMIAKAYRNTGTKIKLRVEFHVRRIHDAETTTVSHQLLDISRPISTLPPDVIVELWSRQHFNLGISFTSMRNDYLGHDNVDRYASTEFPPAQAYASIPPPSTLQDIEQIICDSFGIADKSLLKKWNSLAAVSNSSFARFILFDANTAESRGHNKPGNSWFDSTSMEVALFRGTACKAAASDFIAEDFPTSYDPELFTFDHITDEKGRAIASYCSVFAQDGRVLSTDLEKIDHFMKESIMIVVPKSQETLFRVQCHVQTESVEGLKVLISSKVQALDREHGNANETEKELRLIIKQCMHRLSNERRPEELLRACIQAVSKLEDMEMLIHCLSFRSLLPVEHLLLHIEGPEFEKGQERIAKAIIENSSCLAFAARTFSQIAASSTSQVVVAWAMDSTEKAIRSRPPICSLDVHFLVETFQRRENLQPVIVDAFTTALKKSRFERRCGIQNLALEFIVRNCVTMSGDLLENIFRETATILSREIIDYLSLSDAEYSKGPRSSYHVIDALSPSLVIEFLKLSITIHSLRYLARDILERMKQILKDPQINARAVLHSPIFGLVKKLTTEIHDDHFDPDTELIKRHHAEIMDLSFDAPFNSAPAIPSDWRRDPIYSCQCELCMQCSEFLKDIARWKIRISYESRKEADHVFGQLPKLPNSSVSENKVTRMARTVLVIEKTKAKWAYDTKQWLLGYHEFLDEEDDGLRNEAQSRFGARVEKMEMTCGAELSPVAVIRQRPCRSGGTVPPSQPNIRNRPHLR